MSKQEIRKKFKDWQRVIKFAPILEDVGVPKTNFSQFMNGKDNSLSLEKLESIELQLKIELKEIEGDFK